MEKTNTFNKTLTKKRMQIEALLLRHKHAIKPLNRRMRHSMYFTFGTVWTDQSLAWIMETEMLSEPALPV